MSNPLFLAKVKTSHFAVGKTRGRREGDPRNTFNVREVKRVENRNADEIFVVIGLTSLQEGYSEYLGSDEGYGFVGKPKQVAILARSIGRRFKAILSDLTIVDEGCSDDR